MTAKSQPSLAEKEAMARKNSVLLRYAYHTTPARGRLLVTDYPKVNPELLRLFEELVEAAMKYKKVTGRQLPILGELGELFVEIWFGVQRHRPMTQGSDGKLGNDFVEVKTMTPDKGTDTLRINLAGNFSKLVVVKITDDFQFGARMIDRKILKKDKWNSAELSWDDMIAGEPHPEMHKQFPFPKVLPKRKTQVAGSVNPS